MQLIQIIHDIYKSLDNRETDDIRPGAQDGYSC